MTGDVILSRCREYAGEARALRARIRRKGEIAQSITRAISAVPGSGSGDDKMATLAAQKDALERALELRRAAYAEELAAAEIVLDKISEPDAAKIMYLYYVQGKMTRDIAQEVSRSVRGVQDLHAEALREAKRVRVVMSEWYIAYEGGED